MAGSPVGLADIVKMHYEIGYGTFDAGQEDKLAWTDSFKEGISLSEINWSYVNTATDKGDETVGKIGFTLHDIAGLLFEKFMILKNSSKYIYFTGPLTDGKKWGSTPALYQLDKESCNMEFSQTQGFTYTFSGTAAAAVSKSNEIASPYEFTITNVIKGTDKTFKELVEVELVKQWNDKINACKAGTSKIKVTVATDGINSTYAERKVQNNDTKNEGATGGTFQFSVKKDMTIYDAISSLWNTSFQNATDAKNNVRVRVDFEKWEGSEVNVKILFTDKTIEASLNNILPICVGDDVNCNGWPYRGELSSIDFREISKLLLPTSITDSPAQQQGASKATDITPDAHCDDGSRAHSMDKEKGQVTQTNVAHKPSTMLNIEEGGRISYWGKMYDKIQKTNAAPLTIEINMPYTSDFAPESYGGKLLNGLNGKAATIHLSQAAQLGFFWYDTPDCDKLVMSPVISATYRVASVSHQIGLSGNQTVVKLAHLQLGS